jgi:hypothetical protein
LTHEVRPPTGGGARVRFRAFETGGAARWGEGHALSAGGLRLRTDEALPVGEHLALEVHMDEGRPPLLALACVLTSAPFEGAYEHQLQFLWRGEDDKSARRPA